MNHELEHENRLLRQKLKDITQEASNNEALLNKFLQREIALLSSGSLPELLVNLTEGLRQSFSLDEIRLLLVDSDQEIRNLLNHNNTPEECFPEIHFVDRADEIRGHLRKGCAPWLGPCREERHNGLFGIPENRSIAVLPLNLRDTLIGCLALGSKDPRRFTRQHSSDFLQRLTAIGSVCLENAVNRERIILSGLTDALTGFYNRAYLERRLNEEISRAARYQQPLSCLFLDIDFFKRVNDTHGHASGDKVLKEVATRIKNQLRASDIPTRFGGEEFTLLLPQTGSEEAMLLAERIRHAVQAAPVSADTDVLLNITISIGASQILAHQHDNLQGLGQELLQTADSALYRAKESGRNRAMLYQPQNRETAREKVH
ncbi:MAG: sensor domain-containing diguanylate cyclase [Chromatiales bacterium]|jgi:diguanylate cyclase (GGDEF)-like protein